MVKSQNGHFLSGELFKRADSFCRVFSVEIQMKFQLRRIFLLLGPPFLKIYCQIWFSKFLDRMTLISEGSFPFKNGPNIAPLSVSSGVFHSCNFYCFKLNLDRYVRKLYPLLSFLFANRTGNQMLKSIVHKF